MDTGRSRRRPLQLVVICSQLPVKRLPLFEITLREGQKLIQLFAGMVAAHRLVQSPPDQFHGIALGAVRRERMQAYALAFFSQVFLNPVAGVARIVVRCQVQLLMAAIGPPEVFEQLHEQLGILAIPDHPVQATRSEVERSADPRFSIAAGSRKLLLLALAHPAETHPWVQLQLRLVLEERARFFFEHLQDLSESSSLRVGICGGRDRTRSSPAELEAVQSASKRFSTNEQCALFEQLQHKKRTTPARTQPAVRDGQLLFHQTLDPLVRWVIQQGFGPSPFAVVKGRLSFLRETIGDRVDGGSGAEKHPGDLGRAVAVGDQQHDVHSQSPGGFALTLHPDDEVLGLLWSEGDTLHGRPSLSCGWLDLVSLPCHRRWPSVQLSCASI